jgi:hypothetical protein
VGGPGGGGGGHLRLTGDAVCQALACQHAQLRFGDVEPAPVLGCMNDLQFPGQPQRFRRLSHSAAPAPALAL